MHPSNVTVSEITGTKLKAAGWNQETVYVWHRTDSGKLMLHWLPSPPQLEHSSFSPAPTEGEILEELPRRLWRGDDIYFLVIHAKINDWIVYYHIPEEPSKHLHVCASIHLEEAAAEMWLWVKEYQKTEAALNAENTDK